ncbi:hypothetical protein TNCV_278291 [Trichonephila clavipes]|nr:hypothetical protein TNCV_278291 [Trichonephila clavipes]
MNFPPRQCASSFRVICQEIPGQTQHPSVRASTLLARPGTIRLLFIRPRFSRHRSPFFPRSDLSPLSLPGPSLYIVCIVRPVARCRHRSLHAPHKSKNCPLWLILPFQTPGTENSQTEHTIIAKVKSLDDCSSRSSLKQTHEIVLTVHTIEISDYVPRKI